MMFLFETFDMKNSPIKVFAHFVIASFKSSTRLMRYLMNKMESIFFALTRCCSSCREKVDNKRTKSVHILFVDDAG